MPKPSVAAATSGLQALTPASVPTRMGGFLLLVAVSVACFWQPLTIVIGRSLNAPGYQHYSHIILLPFMSAYLLYLNRGAILRDARLGLRSGILLTAAGAATAWLAGSSVITLGEENRLSLLMLGLVTFWVGAFVVFYGPRVLRTAAFPFFLLLFMVPVPPRVLAGIIAFLQHASADASGLLFGLTGMSVFRRGLYFDLPGLSIHVAEECSGIRSSLALLITSLVMGYLLLRSTWTRAVLVLVIVPLTIVKNAFRIVALSSLAVYVDRSFITGSIVHSSGGIPLFVGSLAILGGLAWLLRRFEPAEVAR